MSVFFTGIMTAEIGGWLYGGGGPVPARRVGRPVVEDDRAGDEVAGWGAAAAGEGAGEFGDAAAVDADLRAEAAGERFVDVAPA
ncbi:hypothetical protein [Streptomyces sp. NPDC047973]|uniref:hypothetical protein n=1 Tax=Streptomyces sp. NPDC047973 TaxID=3155383 RepID=UPI0034356B17